MGVGNCHPGVGCGRGQWKAAFVCRDPISVGAGGRVSKVVVLGVLVFFVGVFVLWCGKLWCGVLKNLYGMCAYVGALKNVCFCYLCLLMRSSNVEVEL